MRIQLKNYRCHKQKIFEIPHSGLHIISGPSGKGKSTLLSAICCGLFGEKSKRKEYIHMVQLHVLFFLHLEILMLSAHLIQIL